MTLHPSRAVVFDIGRVLVRWDLRYLYAKLIDDPAQLEWFVTHVVTQEWHFQHDAGLPLAPMLAERKAQFPQYAALLDAYAQRFLETIPGRVAGTHALVGRLTEAGVPLFALTNFGTEFWAMFRPTEPTLDLFEDIVVSGAEKLAKPDHAIYRLAQQRFGREARNLFFIDDSEPNVIAARECGWQAHLFRDAVSLEAALIEQGFLE
ncbi:HAD-IA family hydrolase [Altererythrobacter aquiaggeris]|uniref:HAD-IA family hydrolase n=1 Tax=Aestuarierythrobacter aquiaggeris TaxID=1898396 RepID=UPI00301B04F5